jgi:nitroreductase
MTGPHRPIDPGPAATVADAVRTRRSVRQFLDRPVDPAVVRELLELASWAPSGSNLQPWRVHVVTGAALARLVAALRGAYLAGEPPRRDYAYYTDPIEEPYLARRRQCGWGLYGTLGIRRGEVEKMRAQRARNYEFFGAPCALVFTIDRRLEKGSWLDYGMFLQTVMLAARARGLHTCPQASIGEYADRVRGELGIAADESIVCGMALGYADPEALVNTFQPPRIALAEFVRHHE